MSVSGEESDYSDPEGYVDNISDAGMAQFMNENNHGYAFFSENDKISFVV